jgi:hypothetical protein
MFEIKIVGASWNDALPEEVCTLSNKDSEALLIEVRSWYMGLSDVAKSYVTGVVVTPPAPIHHQRVHVRLEIVHAGLRLSQEVIFEGEGFIYDLETKTVGTGRADKLSLRQALTQALDIFLLRVSRASSALSKEMLRVSESLDGKTK